MNPKQFIFDSYSFDPSSLTAKFHYSFDTELNFTEIIQFADFKPDYDQRLLDRALKLAFFVIGTSYYKTFPVTDVVINQGLDEWQAAFLDSVYQAGLSQFAYENKLTRANLAHFTANRPAQSDWLSYEGSGVIALQSGGKDSLLLGSILNQSQVDFSSLYVTSTAVYPQVIDDLQRPVLMLRRQLDKSGLARAIEQGGLNGHVPVTYIMAALALVQAILRRNNTVLLAIGHEGEEPHEMIGDLPVRHQWSKTWAAEKQLADYVSRYISPDLHIGSPLRQFSELKIAELFSVHAWEKFGYTFSSCNVANYGQGQTNEQLKWCSQCPKCANNFLLLAPFVKPDELSSLFSGQNILQSPVLLNVFKGLMGIDSVMKPFECVGEVDELRQAYHLARSKWGKQTYGLPFRVPASGFDYKKTYESQPWADNFLKGLR